MSAVAEWLPRAPVADMVAELLTWGSRLCDLVAATEVDRVQIVLGGPEPRDETELLALASGFRLPQPSPTLTDSEGPLRDFMNATLASLSATGQAASQTAVNDAVHVLRRGIDPTPALDVAEAEQLRAAGREVVAALVASGASVSGAKDLLQWPLPSVDGAIPMPVAVDAMAEILQSELEGASETAADVERVAQLAADVAAHRERLAALDEKDPPLAALPGRELLARLWRIR
ncbi:hypothetical protein [Nocardioides limicola]|uniref:hypothetical protein n=1 Tax=Nocardioides limicola TaxID=2803368 RepID=UPI00193B72B5|nr:hypothetical protein [Nocardioides sp. DJM-14]